MKKLSIAITLALALTTVACQQTAQNTDLNTQQQSKLNDLTTVASIIPNPAQMQVDIVANGRVSTLNHIDIVNVGKQIPYTYSHGKVTNSPGFQWYVSKHFALKSDRPIDQVQLYMELLEMSYPHYIELFGAEPANIENQRMAAVYGSSKSATKVFVTDDGLQRGIHAGGEAMYYNLAGYSFPSAREQHQRYIVIHEQGHAFQMALMDYPGWLPTWFTEGTADALAHHYYDPKKKQLKVMVFDRGSPMDYVRLGLKQYKQLNKPTILDMTENPELYRGINFFIVHFMLDDPRRSHLFKAYRDEMARLRQAQDNGGKETSRRVMAEIFGDWAQIEKDFAEYVAQIDKTFHVAAGPWEQDGNRYWVRTLNNSYEHGSPRMDIYLPPGAQPQFNPAKIDQPLPDSPTLLDPIARGTKTPSIGIEVDYQKDHLGRGHVGLALAVKLSEDNRKRLAADEKVGAFEQKSYRPDEDQALNIKLLRGETLLLEGQSIGGENIRYAVPFEMLTELDGQAAPRVGITIKIEERRLVVTLQTALNRFTSHYPITKEIHQKLLSRPVGLLAENAEHRITPYFDDGRKLNPHPIDISRNGPVNPWGNPADKAISRLTRAIWQLGDKAPQSLIQLNDRMIAATTQGNKAQLASLELFEQALPELVKAITNSGQSADKLNRALTELSGIRLRLEWRKTQDNGEKEVAAVLYNDSGRKAQGSLQLTQADAKHQTKGAVTAETTQQVVLLTDEQSRSTDDKIRAEANVDWLGAKIQLKAQSDARPYPWSSMAIVEQAKTQGKEVRIVSELRGPHAGQTKGKLIVRAYPSDLFEQPVLEQAVEIKPYEVRQFASKFQLKEGVKATPYAVDVSFEVDIDGEPVLLKKRSKVRF